MYQSLNKISQSVITCTSVGKAEQVRLCEGATQLLLAATTLGGGGGGALWCPTESLDHEFSNAAKTAKLVYFLGSLLCFGKGKYLISAMQPYNFAAPLFDSTR